MLSRLDVALDLICEDEAHVAGLEGYLRRHLVRRYARNGKPAAYESTVYWSSRKQAPNAPVLYGEPYSRDTGELFCVHLEWRTKRAATLKRMGVASATDLIGFDYYRFWDKRLCLKSVDLSKLGRWAQGTRRRNTWIKNGIDRDLRAGGLVARNRAVLNRDGEPVLGCYAAAQHLHDAKARRALKRLDHGWLLPDAPEPEPTGDGDGLVNTTMLQLYPTTRTKLRNQQQDASTTPRDQQAGTGRSKTWWSPQQLSTYLEGCSKSLRSTYQAIFSPPKPSKPPP